MNEDEFNKKIDIENNASNAIPTENGKKTKNKKKKKHRY